MPKFDASSAECLVFTFKEGLLSAVAHDLKINVGTFEVDVADDWSSITAKVDTSSLTVVNAMKDGADSPGTLSDKDKKEIEKNIVKDVLHPAKYPEATFTSSSVEAKGDGYLIKGTLTLHGVSKEVSVEAKRDGGNLVAELPINQPDYGIKPFSAMLGTLKIQPEVKVRISLPV